MRAGRRPGPQRSGSACAAGRDAADDGARRASAVPAALPGLLRPRRLRRLPRLGSVRARGAPRNWLSRAGTPVASAWCWTSLTDLHARCSYTRQELRSSIGAPAHTTNSLLWGVQATSCVLTLPAISSQSMARAGRTRGSSSSRTACSWGTPRTGARSPSASSQARHT